MLTSRIPLIIVRSAAAATLAVRRAEARIERRSKERSRVRTGAMRGGWQSHPLGPTEGMVFNIVPYTIYNEFGTIHMSAQPMLRPAVEETRPEFELEIRSAYG